MVRLYWTDLDIVLSLHVPEERPYVLQCLFAVFALQPKIGGPITKKTNTEELDDEHTETKIIVHTGISKHIILSFKAIPQ